MKTHAYLRLLPVLCLGLAACNAPNEPAAEPEIAPLTTQQMADSIRFFRRNFQQTDFLSRKVVALDRAQAIAIQLELLDQELAEGATLVGWKMGGTATADAAAFDPVPGFILDRYLTDRGGMVDSNNFPGGSVMVEGEIGFVLKNDLQDGVASKEDLMAQIDYVVGAVELAKSTAIPVGDTTLHLNYVVATGMGQVGAIPGTVKVEAQAFDFEQETVKCFINGTLAAEGVASNIFGTPLNALFELANLLPKHDRYLKAGDLVITGSLYQNPSIEGPAEVRLEFSTLGTIDFKSK